MVAHPAAVVAAVVAEGGKPMSNNGVHLLSAWLWPFASLALTLAYLFFTQRWLRRRAQPTAEDGLIWSDTAVSPATLRYVIHKQYDSGCLISAMTHLVCLGYCRFSTEPTTALERTDKAPSAELANDERQLLAMLFADHPRVELDPSENPLWERAFDGHKAATKRQGNGYFNTAAGYITIAIVLALISFSLATALPSRGLYYLEFCGLFIYIQAFGSSLILPSTSGRLLRNQIQQWRTYLTQGRQALPPDYRPITHEQFEQRLPYAAAVGQDLQWLQIYVNSNSQLGNNGVSPPPFSWWQEQHFGSTNDVKDALAAFGHSIGNAVSRAMETNTRRRPNRMARSHSRSSGSQRGRSANGGGGGW